MFLSSRNTYQLPLESHTTTTGIHRDSPAHVGEFGSAIDFAVAIGSMVVAPLAGQVTAVENGHIKYGTAPEFASYANYVVLEHANDERSEYLHLQAGSIDVSIGETVTTGQVLGRVGMSGRTSTPHLHWYVYTRPDAAGQWRGLQPRLDAAAQAVMGQY